MKWKVLFVKSTGSTNEDLLKMGKEGEPGGTVLVAEEQTAGRGRMTRKWFSPAGAGLYVSVLVRPKIPADQAGLLSFCAANAMRTAIAETGLTETGIKWPNDLVARGKKICGILSSCQAEKGMLEFAVIGLGVNLLHTAYPPDLTEKAGSLEEMGVRVGREDLLYSYLRYLEQQLRALETDGMAVIEETKNHCATLECEVLVSGIQEIRGVAKDIDRNGELIVEIADGTLLPVRTGDVSVRGVMGYV